MKTQVLDNWQDLQDKLEELESAIRQLKATTPGEAGALKAIREARCLRRCKELAEILESRKQFPRNDVILRVSEEVRMIAQIIAELEAMDKAMKNLQADIDRVRAIDSRLHDNRINYLEGQYEGMSDSYRRFKRLIDQTTEGIAWERGQAEK